MKRQKEKMRSIEKIENPESISGGSIPPQNIKIVPPDKGLPLVPQENF